jgi:hypothetical protein
LELDGALKIKVPISEIMVSPGADGLEETLIREIELPPKTLFKPEEKTI